MLPYDTSLIDNQAVIGILRRAYNHVDQRLMDHGIRVSYVVSRLLQKLPQVAPVQLRDICFLAAMHDVGAYKTEEIDRMVQFETESIWDHSIYGYLFVKNFTPLAELAPAVLFHHTPWSKLKALDGVSGDSNYVAQLISIADRLDIWMNMQGRPFSGFLAQIRTERDRRFRADIVDRMAEEAFSAFSAEDAEKDPGFQRMQAQSTFTHEEMRSYLRMIIFTIDFRSRHTVTHTMTTTSLSNELALHMGLDPEYRNQIIAGAILHDLGKIGIPVEILEYPGKLTPQAMKVMRTHVDITEEILGGDIPAPIRNIALRHHEKLNGSGYPRGLTAEDLTVGERIVALADIISALAGTRSYKKAYGKERILSIIAQMRDDGQLDADLVDCMVAHYDGMMEKTCRQCLPILDVYEQVQAEYRSLHARYTT
ncbi:HD domain-containing phosphohydrolase [uncultured Oscillibacter sp.]|uniref:HD-GYP domain-containing protein n=1 Tax=uncultured Oscillibacter sp. TaxID=876091 RepID=UPI0028054F17|nr:HD domain-containing phosphohydrolase [uncultured Oscillibacter sp.]